MVDHRSDHPVGQMSSPSTSPEPRHNPRALSRRDFLRLAGWTAAGVVLNACALLRPKPPRPSGEKVQLVYQDWRTDWFPPMAQQMLDLFHADHPDIRVFYIPDPESAEFNEKMMADMEAGTAADVFQGCCTHFPAWAQKGYTLNLRPYVDADLDRATLDDWDPAQYQAFFTRQGQQYGLPKYHGALALYYNKSLFDANGVAYPDAQWGHEEYHAAMRPLTQDRDADDRTDLWGSMLDISWDRLQMHINGWGGHLVDPQDSTRCRMAEPEALAALEWVRARLWDDRVMPTALDLQKLSTRQAFIAQRAAMAEEGSWALKDILSAADFAIGIAPFPAGPVRRVTLATTDGFGIYARTRHPEAAWELMKFLTSREYGRAMARANFLQPARASLLDEWVGFIQAEFPEKAKGVDIAAFADGHTRGYSVTTEIFDHMAEAVRLTDTAWDQIFNLGQAPVEEMRAVCRQIEEAQT